MFLILKLEDHIRIFVIKLRFSIKIYYFQDVLHELKINKLKKRIFSKQFSIPGLDPKEGFYLNINLIC